MRVKILDERLHNYPIKPSTDRAAAVDLRACIQETITLYYNEQLIVPLGVACEVPDGCGLFLLPRSGLGSRGLILANTVGLIDPDYRGEVCAVLWNRKEVPIKIEPMERIVQATLVNCYAPIIQVVDDLEGTDRDDGGFGHTGKM